MFYNDTSTIPEIRVVSLDEDSDSFKLFLDCLMGFENCTRRNVYAILPIALKYEVMELVEKWIDMLKPEDFNEEVCLTLNLAIKYNCQGLLMELFEFLTEDGRINRIFDEAKYYHLLEPYSICKILDYVKVDSFVLETVFKWAEYYLRKNGKPVDFKNLFEECNIIDKIDLKCFETTSAIFNFNDSELARRYFTAEEILTYIRKNGLNECKSEWVRVEAGVEIEENFKITNLVKLEGYKTLLVVYRNPVVFYNIPDKKSMMSWNILCTLNSGNVILGEDQLDFNIPDDNFVAVIRITDDNAKFLDIKIKWKFNYDCRILRISPIFITDKENVFYTKNIAYMYEREAGITKIGQKCNGKKILLDKSAGGSKDL